MGKTVTVRLNEDAYQKIKLAAQADKRTISNFIEYATISHIKSSSFVSDEEMQDILADENLIFNLQKSLKDIEKGHYRVVE